MQTYANCCKLMQTPANYCKRLKSHVRWTISLVAHYRAAWLVVKYLLLTKNFIMLRF